MCKNINIVDVCILSKIIYCINVIIIKIQLILHRKRIKDLNLSEKKKPEQTNGWQQREKLEVTCDVLC